MGIKKKLGLAGVVIFVLAIIGLIIYFKFFFTFEQRNRISRKIETFTGQNLTITVFDVNGEIIKRWTGVQKITSGEDFRNYVYFYTKDGKYVQLPNTLWYIAEEE